MSGSAATASARRRLRRASTEASMRPSFSSIQRSSRPSWWAGRRASAPSITSAASSASAAIDVEMRDRVPSLSATHRLLRASAVRMTSSSTGSSRDENSSRVSSQFPSSDDVNAPRQRRTHAHARESLRELDVDRRIDRRAQRKEPLLPERDRRLVRGRDARVVNRGVLVAVAHEPGRFDVRPCPRFVLEIAPLFRAHAVRREERHLARAVGGDELAADVERFACEAKDRAAASRWKAGRRSRAPGERPPGRARPGGGARRSRAACPAGRGASGRARAASRSRGQRRERRGRWRRSWPRRTGRGPGRRTSRRRRSASRRLRDPCGRERIEARLRPLRLGADTGIIRRTVQMEAPASNAIGHW